MAENAAENEVSNLEHLLRGPCYSILKIEQQETNFRHLICDHEIDKVDIDV